MKYISTRGEAEILSFEDVLLKGLASDGGLYVPEEWPVLSPSEIMDMAGKSYCEVAMKIIWPYTGGNIPREDLENIIVSSYSVFDHPAVVPLVQISNNQWVLELFHGPTLAFKDIAMQFLAHIMEYLLLRREERATVIVATSGDTGGAAAEAFQWSDCVDLVILFPAGRISDVQRRMMTTPYKDNIHALEVEGTFDDCQELVKAMFRDRKFREDVKLSGVNSINWARIVPQIAYYFYAAVNLGAPCRPTSFVVPTGNFGNIFAGYASRKMGLGVENLIIASNENDILPRTINTGVYEKRVVHKTCSPSMDIQIASNFERFLFDVQGCDAALVKNQMVSLEKSGFFEVAVDLDVLKQNFSAVAAKEDEVATTIRETMERSSYLLDPHTACGVSALSHYKSCSAAPNIVLATAHPSKFHETMKEITNRSVDLPERLKHILTDREQFTTVSNDLKCVQNFVRSSVRATQ